MGAAARTVTTRKLLYECLLLMLWHFSDSLGRNLKRPLLRDKQSLDFRRPFFTKSCPVSGVKQPLLTTSEFGCL
jgi:hypothetical protein